jgi:hypothetical protein
MLEIDANRFSVYESYRRRRLSAWWCCMLSTLSLPVPMRIGRLTVFMVSAQMER